MSHNKVMQRRYLFLVVLILVGSCGPPQSYTLEITGQGELRPIALVSFEVPRRARGVSWQAYEENGTVLPVQIDDDGEGSVIVTDLVPGEVRRLELMQGESAEGVYASEQAGMVSFSTRYRPVVAYHADKQPMPRDDIDSVYHRSGYVHPVYTPSGHMVTDDYPPNHVHHHGIWSAWTRTSFMGRNPDFWNMGARTGTVLHLAVDSVWEGNVHGGLKASHVQVDLSGDEPTEVLQETWHMRVFNVTSLHIFDLSVTQELVADSALHLLEHHYGGVGLRGARSWNGTENADFLTSEGLTRAGGHATRARWSHVGGLVDSQKVGIAVLGHPDNHEAPQPMRIHPDEPFFNYAPTQAGSFMIRPGEVYQMQYRYVVYDGDPDPELLDALWQDYAYPLVGTLRR